MGTRDKANGFKAGGDPRVAERLSARKNKFNHRVTERAEKVFWVKDETIFNCKDQIGTEIVWG